ncbi:MAG: hypothetical protein JWM80_1588 [Cyanobacteria bacterium RYN_339]|nr:hypothetical protein [Cyanobacteria bacterium RYN_339]
MPARNSRRAARWCRTVATLMLLGAGPAHAEEPEPLVITPWPVDDPNAHVLRFYPGLTFKQGQAPIHDEGVRPAVPAEGGMALGIGLEGRLGESRAFQLLANLSPSPFAPVFDPRFSLHGYMLPRPSWGLDGDLATDLHGALTAEAAASWLLRPTVERSPPFRQARLAVGRRALTDPGAGYGYGQLSLFRDDPGWLLGSSLTLFSTLGGWRCSFDGTRTQDLTDRLRWRLDGSVGGSGGVLPAGDRLGAGLLSHDWQTAATRASLRSSLVAPLLRGLELGYKPVALLRQVEGSLYLEGAGLVGADAPSRDGGLAGLGAELVLVSDTSLGFPLAISLGYAVPCWSQEGPTAPWPGHFYLGTTVATFPLQR